MKETDKGSEILKTNIIEPSKNTDTPTETPVVTPNNTLSIYTDSKKSNRLSGGSIAAIIICLVLVLALVTTITIIYGVKGKNKNKFIKSSETNSTILPICSHK